MAAVLALLRRFRIDPYLVLILAMVGLATVLPVRGGGADVFGWATKGAIALLFFFHGARLSRQAVLAALTHWRLHSVVLAASFVLFPALGLLAGLLPPWLLSPPLAAGVLFLCCLPSTVQSSIAFVGIARGNVAAAVVAASASNLFGIVLTPLLVTLLMHTQGSGHSVGLAQIEGIVLQLLLPFILGQLASRWIGAWVQRYRQPRGWYDRGTILMVVYGAFSAAVVEGIWSRVSWGSIGVLLGVCGVLLVVLLASTAYAARALGFSKEDEITIVMCGSKKSLASGAPMAGILFPPAAVGLILLPLMIFHQIQLMACAALAQRYAQRPQAVESAP